MDSVISVCKGTIFLLSYLKESPFNNKMDTNKEVVSRLKFISRINKGEKINVRSAYPFVQQDDMSTRLSRTFYYKDNRGNALNFVRNTIDRSFEILNLYQKSRKKSEKALCNNIVTDLKRAKNGINNLRETYTTDTMFCCDLDTILQEIDAKLMEICKDSEREAVQVEKKESSEEEREEDDEKND